MSRPISTTTLALIAVVLTAPFGVLAQENGDAFAAGEAYFEAGDFAAALAQFEAARAAGVDEAAVYYNLAVCHYRLGQYAESIARFRELETRYPAFLELAEYNIGLALSRLGREQEARAAFATASRSPDASVAALADAMLRTLGAGADAAADAGGGAASPRWIGLVDLALGHDDNVGLVDEAYLPPGLSGSSPLAEVFALASGPIGGSRWRLDLSAYHVAYPDASRYEQSAVQAGLRFSQPLGAWRLELGPEIGSMLLDGDTFEQRAGVVLDARRELGTDAVLRLRFGRHDVDAGEDVYGFVAGRLAEARVAYEQRLPVGRLALEMRLDDNDRNGASVSSKRRAFSARFRHALNARWFGEAGITLRASRYDKLAEPRDEDLRQLALALVRNTGKPWQYKLEYTWSDNASSDALYAYRRNRVTFGFDRTF